VSRFARIAAVLFIIAVPLFLVSASVTWAVNDPNVYHRGFAKYQISLYTGITEVDLRQVGAEIRHYFNSSDEPLVLRSRVFGEEQEIFDHREVYHMRDVKRLIRGVYAVAVGSGVYLLGAAIARFCWQRHHFVETLARLCLWGGVSTLALVLGVGLFALVGFDTLFLKFHQLSFANDFWQLDPQTDYLVIMFPQGFWLDATMYVAALTAGGAALLTGISGGYLLHHRLKSQSDQEVLSGNGKKAPEG